jgi:hypothetical protein
MYFSFWRCASLLGIALCVCLVFSSPALAHPASGGNCSGCHGASTTGRDTITGNSGLLNLTSRLDGGNLGTFKVFNVLAGQTVPLTINVTDGGVLGNDPPDQFGAALTGSPKPLYSSATDSLAASVSAPGVLHGIENSTGDSLTFAQDSTWTATSKSVSSPAPYTYVYFDKAAAVWTGSTQSYTYNLTVDPSTPSDVYSVFLRATGVDNQALGSGDSSYLKWTQGEEVLINVTAVPEPGTLALLAVAGVFVALGIGRWRRRTG